MRLKLVRCRIAGCTVTQLLAAVVVVLVSHAARGAEPLHVQIDRLIAFQTPDYDRLAAPLAGDDEFMRRVTLDLVGSIPAAAEVRAFLADADPAKREKLVDKLLATPEH